MFSEELSLALVEQRLRKRNMRERGKEMRVRNMVMCFVGNGWPAPIELSGERGIRDRVDGSCQTRRVHGLTTKRCPCLRDGLNRDVDFNGNERRTSDGAVT